MVVQIQLRRGTAALWTSTNPTLAQGEMGLEDDTGKFKVGDGATAWTGLPYSSGIPGPSYTLPTATSSVLGGVKPDGATITNTAGAISVAYGMSSTTAAVGNDSRITGALSATTAASTYLALSGGTMTGGITNSTAINPLTTLAESWVGPSSTAGIYFKGGLVGIRTISPLSLLHIFNTTNSALASQLLLQNQGSGSNTAAIAFQVSASNEYTTYGPKGGIAFQRTSADGGGSLIFYNRRIADTSAYQTTDAVLSFPNSGGAVLAGALTLGGSGTLGSITMGNATSGTVTIQPVTGALGTVTLLAPAINDTLVTLTATQTLTNKNLILGTGTATAVAGAATVNQPSGIVTSQALTAQTTYALTLTNSFIATTSVIQLTLSNSDGLATWPVSIVCSAGSAVITVGMAALTGTVKIIFSVAN